MKKDSHLAIILVIMVFTMLGIAYASVPLYRLFCQKTGYGGTPQIGGTLSSENKPIDRQITVQFTATTHRDLNWGFKPLQHSITIKIGESGMAYYWAENYSDQPIIGMATYNVSPDKAARYFHKIACFCFEEQKLDPKQGMEMPVLFFIDPAFAQDPQLKNLHTITLSYTFFNLKSF